MGEWVHEDSMWELLRADAAVLRDRQMVPPTYKLWGPWIRPCFLLLLPDAARSAREPHGRGLP